MVWLLVLAVAATLTINVLSRFESVLQEVVSLALFIPFLIGIGGNVGAQSVTTVIRALALNDVREKEFIRIILREARVGLLLGCMMAFLGFALVWWFIDPTLALIVSLTLVTICTLASLVGSTMPVLARYLGVDPAVVSAPFVTTIVDASGLLVYFLIARLILPEIMGYVLFVLPILASCSSMIS